MTIRTHIEKPIKSVFRALDPAPSEDDILSTLKAEHDDVQDMLEKLTASSNGREQKQLVTKIKAALVPHNKAEERVVYDAILGLKGRDARIDGHEGYMEHSLGDTTLKKLEKLTANTPEFKAAAKVLKELVNHHVEEEERNIWALVRENFTDEEREAMNHAFLVAKKKVRV